MLALPSPEAINRQINEELEAAPQMETADTAPDLWLEQLLKENPQAQREAIDQLGLPLQQQARQQSELLQAPLPELAAAARDGGPVARLLEQLQHKMQALNPQQKQLEAQGFQALLTRLPGMPTPLQRYFRQFETAQDALNQILEALEAGKERLKRDNLTLAKDQKALKETLAALHQQIHFTRELDRHLEDRTLTSRDSEQQSWLENELLFPLRQRTLDLQQQLSVCQQGVIAQEIIIRNNRELIRGVDRALNVTLSALQVAVTVALALGNQKLVLNQIAALNNTTNQLLAGTAQQLRQQGVEIQRQASSSLIDLDTLEQAFTDMLSAVDELNAYRQEALPLLNEQIDRLAALNSKAEATASKY
ncbi:toxic anion resistance protein [Marinospirillum sp.]|uniref:toxic anion resistance protein n=1 Tax=Marinospirillum sp. TaxID=2183934 RepID=UPI0038508D19